MNPDSTSLTPMHYVSSTPPAVEVGDSRDQLERAERESECEEIEYQSVPPRRSATVRVRYRAAGRGRPLPYPLPPDADE